MGKFEKFLFGVVGVFIVLLLFSMPLYVAYREFTGANDKEAAAREKEAREGPCIDKVVMLATTAGSPNQVDCPNVWHTTRVTVSMLSGEEVAATVHCECVKGD